MKISGDWKVLRSESYNYQFNMRSGFFARWGKTPKDDPQFGPFGPELVDIEVSTSCSQGCPWCYKNNMPLGENMSIDTFKVLFGKLPDTVTQIAFGIGDIDGNPDLLPIFEHCREHKVVPNVTIDGSRLTPERASALVRLCGSIAVSHYDDDTCFDAVDILVKEGGKQINIHQLMARETVGECSALLDAACNDPRLVDRLNAIVFLSLKQKGRGTRLHPVDTATLTSLVTGALRRQIPFGLDSCSANRFLSVIRDHPRARQLAIMVEPCEGSCFSVYINVDGVAYPCSFIEGQPGYSGVDVLGCKDFLRDVWHSGEFTAFRGKLLANKRKCPEFLIDMS